MPSSTESIQPNRRGRRARVSPRGNALLARLSRDARPERGRIEPVAPPPAGGFEAARDALYAQLREAVAARHLEDELQYEMARWLELLETPKEKIKELKRRPDEVLDQIAREAGVAFTSLLSDKPDLLFARTLRVRAEMELLRHDGWPTSDLVALTDGNPVMIVGLGALCAMSVGMIAHLLWPSLGPLGYVRDLMPFGGAGVPALIGAAFLGGAVSILGRLQSFSKLRDFDPAFLFMNALFKPFLGVIFGLFAYAFWQSGFVPLDPKLMAEALSPYQLWVIGFLAGFSERFSKDLISRGESLLPGPKG
jgi:hypothetical protein